MVATVHVNNSLAYLSTPLTNTATTLILNLGQGAQFPVITAGDKNFWLTVEDRILGKIEIMLCTARAADSLTVVRAQQGTVAQEFAAGTSVTNRVTSGFLDGFDNRINTATDNAAAAAAAAASALAASAGATTTADAAKASADATAASLGAVDIKATNAQTSANAAGAAAAAAQTTANTAAANAATAITEATAAQSAAASAEVSAENAEAVAQNALDIVNDVAMGPQGPVGPEGPEGPQGPTGPTGPMGPPGPGSEFIFEDGYFKTRHIGDATWTNLMTVQEFATFVCSPAAGNLLQVSSTGLFVPTSSGGAPVFTWDQLTLMTSEGTLDPSLVYRITGTDIQAIVTHNESIPQIVQISGDTVPYPYFLIDYIDGFTITSETPEPSAVWFLFHTNYGG